jgi:hypothetical protein
MAAPSKAAAPTALAHTAIAVTQRERLAQGTRCFVITVPVLL